jgi:DNA-binding MarR family transcriptional regulator
MAQDTALAPVHSLLVEQRMTPTQISGCTCFKVRRLARRVTQIYDRVLAPSGLRVTQFSLLSRLLWNGAMPMRQLSSSLDMDRTTLTRNLKPLIEAGLISLAPSKTDARQREAQLTATGRARLDQAKKLWRRAQNEINQTIGPSQIESLHALFDGLIDTLNRSDGAPLR